METMLREIVEAPAPQETSPRKLRRLRGPNRRGLGELLVECVVTQQLGFPETTRRVNERYGQSWDEKYVRRLYRQVAGNYELPPLHRSAQRPGELPQSWRADPPEQPGEREKLQALIQSALPREVGGRAAARLGLIDGKPPAEIAKSLGRHRNYVMLWAGRTAEEIANGLGADPDRFLTDGAVKVWDYIARSTSAIEQARQQGVDKLFPDANFPGLTIPPDARPSWRPPGSPIMLAEIHAAFDMWRDALYTKEELTAGSGSIFRSELLLKLSRAWGHTAPAPAPARTRSRRQRDREATASGHIIDGEFDAEIESVLLTALRDRKTIAQAAHCANAQLGSSLTEQAVEAWCRRKQEAGELGHLRGKRGTMGQHRRSQLRDQPQELKEMLARIWNENGWEEARDWLQVELGIRAGRHLILENAREVYKGEFKRLNYNKISDRLRSARFKFDRLPEELRNARAFLQIQQGSDATTFNALFPRYTKSIADIRSTSGLPGGYPRAALCHGCAQPYFPSCDWPDGGNETHCSANAQWHNSEREEAMNIICWAVAEGIEFSTLSAGAIRSIRGGSEQPAAEALKKAAEVVGLPGFPRKRTWGGKTEESCQQAIGARRRYAQNSPRRKRVTYQQALKALGPTQDEFATRAGVSLRQVQRWAKQGIPKERQDQIRNLLDSD